MAYVDCSGKTEFGMYRDRSLGEDGVTAGNRVVVTDTAGRVDVSVGLGWL